MSYAAADPFRSVRWSLASRYPSVCGPEDSRIVALASADGETVSQAFVEADTLLLCEVSAAGIQIIGRQHRCGGAGTLEEAVRCLRGCDAVVCTHMSVDLMQGLRAQGVDVELRHRGTRVEEVLHSLSSGGRRCARSAATAVSSPWLS